MKLWLRNSGIEMQLIHNKLKFVIAGRFIETLKSKIHKRMTLVSKNVCIDKLDEIVNKFNNAYQRTKKMKTADVKSVTYIDNGVEHNKKIPNSALVFV